MPWQWLLPGHQLLQYWLNLRYYIWPCLVTLSNIGAVTSVVSKIKSILPTIFYALYRAICFQLTHFSFGDCQNICTLPRYLHQIWHMNHESMSMVRSWNNMHSVPCYVPISYNKDILYESNSNISYDFYWCWIKFCLSLSPSKSECKTTVFPSMMQWRCTDFALNLQYVDQVMGMAHLNHKKISRTKFYRPIHLPFTFTKI